jgi:hypothetical protein
MTGASGFIGRRLLKNFAAAGHEVRVLSRHAGTNLPAGVTLFAWDPLKGPPPEESLRDAEAVVNLAGEPVAQRWNAEVKRRIRDSRVIGTRNLVAGIARLARRPAALISASATATGRAGTRCCGDGRRVDEWPSQVCGMKREAAGGSLGAGGMHPYGLVDPAAARWENADAVPPGVGKLGAGMERGSTGGHRGAVSVCDETPGMER